MAGRARPLEAVAAGLLLFGRQGAFDRLGRLMESHIGVRTNRVNALTSLTLGPPSVLTLASGGIEATFVGWVATGS